MAMANLPQDNVPISGVGIVATFVLPTIQRKDMDEDSIKKRLVQELAEKIYNFGYVEFTRVETPIDDTIFRARIFVTPRDKVTMLRTINPDLFE